MKRFLINTLVIFVTMASYGQQDLVLHQMSDVPQSIYVNPSKAPSTRLNIGLPFLSSIYLRHQNTIFNPYHLFSKEGNTINFRTLHYLDQIQKRNYIGLEQEIELLSIGLKVGEKNYFSFGVRERFNFRLSLPGDMLRFPFTGNASFDELEGGVLDFSDFRIGLNHYREYGLGWQRTINEKLSIGGRIKYLYGMENVDTKTSNLQWKTDEDSWDWTFSGGMDVYSSGIWSLTDTIDDNTDIERDEIGDYLFKRKNKGIGLDLGATYAINDQLEVTGSLIDLGFISWKSDNKNFETEDGEFVYSGIELTEDIVTAGSDIQDSLDTTIEELRDDLESGFGYTESSDKYRTSLLTRFYVGANYDLYANDRSSGVAGLLLHSEVYKGTLRPTVTLSYHQKFQRWLSATASYSVIDRDFRNLGLGLSLNAGPVQFYVMTDNILAAVVNKARFVDDAGSDESSSEVVYPAFSRNTHIRTGINLTLGRKPKDSDGDTVLDKDDDCPDVPGLVDLNGCPDTDLDGIADLQDECPQIPGISKFNGCPDTDADGIQDKSDACPEVAGLPKFEGCPDTDSDGVKDSEDNCPEVAGIELFGGCPDTDADGIQDSEDACPEVAGLETFKGCPDTDSDGIQDSEDRCPEVPGTADFKGCPDTDNDGLSDSEDQCPNEAGPLDNQGCPWGDRDGDGLIDKEDSCPSMAGPVENQGCPWEDLDGDGVFDKDDRCPKTPGPAENQGCPVIEEEAQEVINTAFANLEFLSGKDIIKDDSFESLELLAELLVEKTEWKLQIAGHTDNVGKESTNLALSKKRSLAVASFMESRGVPKERLVTKWFGESQPIADNATTEGKQKNRRVEMEVIFE